MESGKQISKNRLNSEKNYEEGYTSGRSTLADIKIRAYTTYSTRDGGSTTNYILMTTTLEVSLDGEIIFSDIVNSREVSTMNIGYVNASGTLIDWSKTF